jgi:DNA repair exonuclease SbcCD ATPase subunit
MTTINRIVGGNVKGRNFNHELGPVTVFVGPNAAGKTAIAEAIRVGLTGQHAKLGKRDVTKLAGGGSAMSITVGFADGNASVHDWTHKDGSWSYKGKLAVGLPVPNVLLDASSYFALTADERIKFVFRLIPADKVSLTADGVVAELNKLAATTSRVVEARRELEKLVEKEVGRQPVSDAMDKLVAHCKKAKAESDAVAKQMAQSILAQTQMQAGEGLAVARNVDADLERVRGNIGELQGRLATAKAAAQAAAQAVPRLGKLAEAIAEAQAEVAHEAALEAEVAGLRAQLDAMPDGLWDSANVAHASLKGDFQRVKQAHAEKVSLLADARLRASQAKAKAERHAELSAKLAPLNARVSEAHHKVVTTISREAANAADAVVEARARVNATASAIRIATHEAETTDRRMAELASHQTCPWCEASEPGWKDKAVAKLATLLDLQKSALADALAAGLEANERLAAASKASDAAAATLRLGESEVQRLDRESAEIEAELRGLATTTHTNTDAELEAMAAEIADLAEQLPKLDTAIVEAAQKQADAGRANTERLALRQRLAQQEVRLAAARGFKARLAALTAEQASLAKVPPGDDALIASIGEALTKLKAEEGALTDAAKRAAAVAQDKLRREQARSEADDTKLVADFWKGAAATLIDLQETIIAAAFSAVLADACRITENILGSPLVYREGEIGRVENGTFISHRTFSGMEERLAYAALQVALAGPESALRLVMIDELGTLDADNKAKLLERMLALTAEGLVGQFIGFDVSDADYLPHAKNGLQVVAVAGK